MATRGAAEPAVYLSALRALLDAASGVAEERAQGIAEAVVQELAVETCAVTLRRHGEPGLRLAGHARRWDAGARPLEAEEALAVGRLAVPDGGALCCARREGGEFRPARVADLAGEGCVVLPVDAGGGAFASVVVHARDAAAGLVPHLGALCLVAEVTGLVLAARDDEPAARAVRLPARAVSHRLRNPLHAILGYSNLVRDGAAGAVNEEQARLLDRVLANSQQLNVVIDDLLFFVEIEAGRVAVRPEPVAFRELVDEVVAALAPPLDGGAVTFRLEMAVGAETLDTDRGVLRRLLFHLLGNAFRYTPQGEVTVAVRPDDEHVQILVRDTGSGISPESARVLAEPAPRAPGAAAPDHGLGMGLSLVRRCVRLLDGTITVRSDPGQGSEFLLRLPRTLRVRGGEKTPDTLH